MARFVQIPKLGYIRLAESLRFADKMIGAAISATAGKWYIAIQVEMPDAEPKQTQCDENQAVGVGREGAGNFIERYSNNRLESE